jgi:hypothetical protein
MEMEILYETLEKWDAERGGVVFWARADGQDVRCFVSRTAVHEAYGGSGSKEDVLRMFSEHRAELEVTLAALIRSGRTTHVDSETFDEAQILKNRVRHRVVSKPMRRVTTDELAGSGIYNHASDVQWWAHASGEPVENITVCSANSRLAYVDVQFGSDVTANAFDYKMSKYGVRTFRIEPLPSET